MVRYGIIEDGVLRTREVEAFPEHYQETENGIAHVIKLPGFSKAFCEKFLA